MKGLAAFSFALTEREPSPCNRRLAMAVKRIIEAEPEMLVASQWEIALELKDLGVPIAFVVEKHRRRGMYLDSGEVMAQIAEFFLAQGVTEVIPVAHPFLHMPLVRRIVRSSNFRILRRRVGWIGFDQESLMWWTRGPVRASIYASLSLAGLQALARRSVRYDGRPAE